MNMSFTEAEKTILLQASKIISNKAIEIENVGGYDIFICHNGIICRDFFPEELKDIADDIEDISFIDDIEMGAD